MIYKKIQKYISEGIEIKKEDMINCILFLNQRINHFESLEKLNRSELDEKRFLIWARDYILEPYSPKAIVQLNGKDYLLYHIEGTIYCPIQPNDLIFYDDLPVFADISEKKAA